MSMYLTEQEKKHILNLHGLIEQTSWDMKDFSGNHGITRSNKSSAPPQKELKLLEMNPKELKVKMNDGNFAKKYGFKNFNVQPSPNLNEVIEHIKKSEEFRSKRYLDSRGVPTIGYGTTNKKYVNKGSIDEKTASKALLEYVEKECIECIQRWQEATNTKINDGMFLSLVDIIYNMGCKGFRNSTIATKLENYELWNAKKIIRNGKWGHEERRRYNVDNFFCQSGLCK